MQEIKKRKEGYLNWSTKKVTTAGRQRRLWAIKAYEEEEGFTFLLPVNTMSGDVVNKSQGNDGGL